MVRQWRRSKNRRRRSWRDGDEGALEDRYGGVGEVGDNTTLRTLPGLVGTAPTAVATTSNYDLVEEGDEHASK